MITPAQRRAIHRVLDALDAAGVTYQCTGGFAGHLHGSRWPLHDLDLDVAAADLAAVSAALGDAVTRAAAPYRDDEFELVLLEADVDGLHVDVAQAEGGALLTRGGWEALTTDLSRRQSMEWDGRTLWTIPLEELRAYKRRMPKRAMDVADLETLDSHR